MARNVPVDGVVVQQREVVQRAARQANRLSGRAAVPRGKADQDPAQWLPPNTKATCRYLVEWTAVKLRWGLTADTEERESLTRLAEACPDATVTYTPAP